MSANEAPNQTAECRPISISWTILLLRSTDHISNGDVPRGLRLIEAMKVIEHEFPEEVAAERELWRRQ